MKKYAVIVFALMFALACSGEGGGGGSIPSEGNNGPVGPGPAVSIISPSPCQRIEGNMQLSVAASDPDGVSIIFVLLNDVVISIMDTPPFERLVFQSILPPDGTYNLKVRAYDTLGNETVASTEVRIDNVDQKFPNLLVVDPNADPLGLGAPHGAVFRINPDTRSVCVLASSIAFSDPTGIAVQTGTGDIWVVDRTADLNGTAPGTGALFRVNPDKFNDIIPIITWSQFVDPVDLQVTANTVFIADRDANPGNIPAKPSPGAIFEYTIATGGTQNVVSVAAFEAPVSLLYESPTSMWIVDQDANFNDYPGGTPGTLFLLSNGTDLTAKAYSQALLEPFELAPYGAGEFLLTGIDNVGMGSIFFINPSQAAGSAIYAYHHGFPMVNPSGILRKGDGTYLIADRDAGLDALGAILSYDPATDPDIFEIRYGSLNFVDPYDVAESWK